MKALGLRTTIYMVPDIAAAKEWYSKAFNTKPYFDEPFYVGFNIGGYELGLHPEEGDAKKGTNILSYWGVENIREAFDELIKKGATERTPITNVGGEIEVATVLDPWENVIGIIYNPDFKLN